MKHLFNYFVMDLETGGFSEKQNPIVEVAVIVLDSLFEEVERRSFLVRNYNNLVYTEGAYQTHHIGEDQIEAEGISSKEAVKIISDLAVKYKESRQKPVLVGHNFVGFDDRFLSYLFKFEKSDFNILFDSTILDTLMLMRMKYGYDDIMPAFNLMSCCTRLDIPLIEAHRAMPDTEASAELFRRIMTDFRFGGNGSEKEVGTRFRSGFKF